MKNLHVYFILLSYCRATTTTKTGYSYLKVFPFSDIDLLIELIGEYRNYNNLNNLCCIIFSALEFTFIYGW